MGRTNMTMTWELVTPKKAERWLKMNSVNRPISMKRVERYARDIVEGRWSENSGENAISFDKDGILRNGQHRLTAIMLANQSINMWICRNTDSDAFYDGGQIRTTAQQISIAAPDLEPVYQNTRYSGVARLIITKGDRRSMSSAEIVEFTRNNKEILDGFFLNLCVSKAPKIAITVVWAGMFFAYCDGVSVDDLNKFYEVLRTGMSTGKKDFPAIAYRNYLKDLQHTPSTTIPEISRCEYAIDRYLAGSGSKQSRTSDELIYPIPMLMV